jgi:hypothetical protein
MDANTLLVLQAVRFWRSVARYEPTSSFLGGFIEDCPFGGEPRLNSCCG